MLRTLTGDVTSLGPCWRPSPVQELRREKDPFDHRFALDQQSLHIRGGACLRPRPKAASERGTRLAPDYFHHLTQTVFRLTNSSMPTRASSRPKPESLMPPKGRRGSDLTIPLTKTEPLSISGMKRAARSRSWVQRLAAAGNRHATVIGD